MKNLSSNTNHINGVNEEQSEYIGFVNKSEDEKLKDNMMRSPIEKLQLFNKMLRREQILKNAKISHS